MYELNGFVAKHSPREIQLIRNESIKCGAGLYIEYFVYVFSLVSLGRRHLQVTGRGSQLADTVAQPANPHAIWSPGFIPCTHA